MRKRNENNAEKTTQSQKPNKRQTGLKTKQNKSAAEEKNKSSDTKRRRRRKDVIDIVDFASDQTCVYLREREREKKRTRRKKCDSRPLRHWYLCSVFVTSLQGLFDDVIRTLHQVPL